MSRFGRRRGRRNDPVTPPAVQPGSMSTVAHTWQRFRNRGASTAATDETPQVQTTPLVEAPTIEIPDHDPLIAYLQSVGGAVEVERLELDSPAVQALREAGVALVVPLVSGGELIGTLNLGPRLSDQQYSIDDRRLLDALAAQAAPALQVAELVHEQATQAALRERIEQELKVAQLIQQNFLPRELPDLPGFQVEAYYKPAREVGGDFYDFFALPDGRVAVVIGDVTDKGVPAAMVMAAARSLLRAMGSAGDAPGAVLARVNDLLCPDIPERMFVTCLYAILDSRSGRVVFANAGHNLPIARRADGPEELRATGMPLGLMPGMTYEEREFSLGQGEALLLYSDGVTEAHDPAREMFGTERLAERVAHGSETVIDGALTALHGFTGTDWEQEDDITMVALRRTALGADPPPADSLTVDASFTVDSVLGNEREAMTRVLAAVASLDLPRATVDRLGTAVSETTMNAIEHGNRATAGVPVEIRVTSDGRELRVTVTDEGGGRSAVAVEQPDLEAKLDGRQTPRGWGLFLIEQMVDRFATRVEGGRHTVELVFEIEGSTDDDR